MELPETSEHEHPTAHQEWKAGAFDSGGPEPEPRTGTRSQSQSCGATPNWKESRSVGRKGRASIESKVICHTDS